MGQPAIDGRVDWVVSARVVTSLAVVAMVVGLALLGLAAYILFEPIAEVGLYVISSVIFLAVVFVIAVELTRRRPRASARFR